MKEMMSRLNRFFINPLGSTEYFHWCGVSLGCFFFRLNFAGSTKDYPLLPDSCPSTPRSRSPQSLRSPSQISEYSGGHGVVGGSGGGGHGGRHSSADHHGGVSDNSEERSSGSPPPPPVGVAAPPQYTHSRHSSAGHLHHDVIQDHPQHMEQPQPLPPVFMRPYTDKPSQQHHVA